MNALAAVLVTVALVATTAGAWRLARAAVVPMCLPPFATGALAAALGCGVFLTATGLAGRWAGRFDVGLAAAALAGVALYLYSRRKVLPIEGPGVKPAAAFGVWAAALAMGALYAYLSAKYQMHDEHALFGHKSMVEQLRYGEYPPFVPPFPTAEVRYHYGFDVLAGALARAYGLSSDSAIDVVCVALVLFMCWAAAAVAADNGAVRSAPFAAVAIHLGAGLAAFVLAGVPGRHPRCLVQYHHPSCGVELFPTQILNVFQHPVSAGVPLLLVVVLLAPRLVERRAAWGHGAAAAALLVVLPALALSQFVYYGLGVLALLCALPFWLYDRSADERREAGRVELRVLATAAVRVLAVLAAAHGLAYALGGMLAPAETIDTNLFLRRSRIGFPENTTWVQIFRHHVVNLGAAFLALPAFAALIFLRRRARRGVVHLVAFACGGILVPHLYTYLRSWDIVKFPSAASFALSMIYVLVVDAALAERTSLAALWWKRLGRTLVCGTGVAAAIFITFPLRADLRLYDEGGFGADAQVQRTIDWLWANGYAKEDLVWAQSNIAQQLAVFGGLSVIGEDSDLYYVGYKEEILRAQRRFSAEIKAALSRKALEELGVRWVILSDEELKNLGPAARSAIEGGGPAWLEEVARFDVEGSPERRRRIWRVKDQLDAEL